MRRNPGSADASAVDRELKANHSALLGRLDVYAERLSRETGLPATRPDVVRLLLIRGISAGCRSRKAASRRAREIEAEGQDPYLAVARKTTLRTRTISQHNALRQRAKPNAARLFEAAKDDEF